ncbi:MAG TPA: long-chain fatty acid--CoA ligase [Spirochaetota bacterium]|nr:long-chain fatty acid--CoA ligase [Spirochaetota bacterium]HPI87955.1 long-chain fatty acid--CoA ligase [Spirochaetota bacterium]HPR46666.1 long-chain fatty acid--CoA ligase [Spirochaetota bacterium]
MNAFKTYDDTTIPGIFKNQVEKSRDKIFVKIRDANNKWKEYSYTETGQMVDALASYFLKKGIKVTDRIAIYSNNRPEWAVSDLAALSIGAADVTIYPTNSGPEALYVLNDSGSRICMCSGKYQVDNLLSEKKKFKNLEEIIVFDDLDYKDPMVVKLSQALETGRKNLNLAEIDKRIRNIDLEETATLIYTSGTTGDPKGVMLTHNNLVANVKQFIEHHPFPKVVTAVSLLPLSHALERTVGYNTCIHESGTLAYTKGAETLLEDLKDIRPTLAVYVPRVLEKLYEGVMAQLRNAPGSKKALFNVAMAVGRKSLPYILSNRTIPFPLGALYRLFDKLIYSKLRKALGLDRMITIGIGGAPLSDEINGFFQAIGVEIHLGYGLTETTPITHLHTFTYLKKIKLGTCGPIFPRTECQVADDGEILIRGPQVMKGYYNRPEDTREVLTEDGWFYTGDIGYLDEDGYLVITDRKKDIIITAGGKNVAPQVIEGMFLMNPFIEQIAIIGDQRKYLVALIVPNFGELAKWAKTKNINETDPSKLIKNPEVVKKYTEVIDELNKPLGRVEQIKRFALIDRAFTQETGELTPTLKVKRKVVLSNFSDIIEDMYKE